MSTFVLFIIGMMVGGVVSECDESKCSSPGAVAGTHDCWAGTTWEGCTCTDGYGAVETGDSGMWVDGKTYYEYECCANEGSTDGTCGDFVPLYERWWFILMMVGIVISIVSCIICCCRGGCCCGGEQRRAVLPPQGHWANPPPQVEMVMTNPPPSVAIPQGMYPQQTQSQNIPVALPIDAGVRLSPKQAVSAPPLMPFVQQAPQQGVPRVVMGPNGQWIIQQPQLVQQIQPQEGIPLHSMVQQQAPQGTVHMAVGQNGQWVMQQPQGIQAFQPNQGVAQLVSTEQVKAHAISPMQQVPHVKDERQIAEDDNAR